MNRRGVATVMAVVVLGLLATVLTSVAAWAVAEQRGGNLATAEAQASQLLRAAADVARGQVHGSRKIDGPIQTPVGRVTLAWHGTACDVDVSYGGVNRSVTLTFDGERVTKAE